MALVSFLYIVTMKVIQHNLDQKVPVYVYNLYKNLDNESKLLTKKLIDDVANGSNTALKEKLNTLNSTDLKMKAILETIDAKTYANILANDFNTVGQIDNDGVSEVATISEKYKDIDITNTNNMSRSFSYTVKDDGAANIKYTPERDTEKMQLHENYCYLWSENRGSNPKQTLKQNANCMYAPTKTNIANLITSQNVNQWYKIDAVKNTINVDGAPSDLTVTVYDDGSVLNPDIQITTSNTLLNIPDALNISKHKLDFVVDNYSLKDKKALFSTNNNLKFLIVTTKIETDPGKVTLKRVYNYTLDYHQDAICPPTDKTNICKNESLWYHTSTSSRKNPTPNAICYYSKQNLLEQLGKNRSYSMKSKIFLVNGKYLIGFYKTGEYCLGYFDNDYYYSQFGVQDKGVDGFSRGKKKSPDCGEPEGYGMSLSCWQKTYFDSFPDITPTKCSDRLDNIKLQKDLIEKKLASINKYSFISTFRYYYSGNYEDYGYSGESISNPFYGDINYRPSIYTQKAKEYYARWNNFFNITKVTRDTRNELNSSITEDNMSNTISFTYPAGLQNNLSYPNHFIYVAIDTPFNKGEMGKNIFAFEHFGSKIIPVGYLANNQNTPLKFDVITRNPETFKIEKVNYKDGMDKRPLTFCEAMLYTGDKFSPYCVCPHPTIKENSLELRDGYYNWYDATKWSGTLKAKRKFCENNFGCIITPVKVSKK